MHRINKQTILKLHQKTNSGNDPKWVELTFTHSLIVNEIAQQIAKKAQANLGTLINFPLLELGALTHDIGVYKCFDDDFHPDKNFPKYICHGTIGYEILIQEGFKPEIARFALTHTSTGITKEDILRDNLPLVPNDYLPVSIEEEILAYADLFHTKWPKFRNYDEIVASLTKISLKKVERFECFKAKFGIPDLINLQKAYEQWHIEMDDYLSNLNSK